MIVNGYYRDNLTSSIIEVVGTEYDKISKKTFVIYQKKGSNTKYSIGKHIFTNTCVAGKMRFEKIDSMKISENISEPLRRNNTGGLIFG